MENQFEPLQPEEIVSLEDSVRILLKQPTFKVSEFIKALMTLAEKYDISIRPGGLTESKANWFSQGVDCEVLKLDAKRWQKGKVRIILEFCPDNPEISESPSRNSDQVEMNLSEAPLDDLRQMLNLET
jgi:hypothetical protein